MIEVWPSMPKCGAAAAIANIDAIGLHGRSHITLEKIGCHHAAATFQLGKPRAKQKILGKAVMRLGQFFAGAG